jgi:hypothetical protein
MSIVAEMSKTPLWSVETGLPDEDFYDELRSSTESWPFVAPDDWDFVRKVIAYEKSMPSVEYLEEEEFGESDMFSKSDAVEVAYGLDRGVGGLCLALYNAGFHPLESCSGHSDTAYVVFAGNTDDTRRLWSIVEGVPHARLSLVHLEKDNDAYMLFSSRIGMHPEDTIAFAQRVYDHRDSF